jgi:Aspartyl/Asparaginyl beta-hydroxylase
LPEARSIVFGLMATVQGERLGRVMINRLRPGGRIAAHADTPVHAEYYSRHHVVLQTAPGANLRCGDETLHLEKGTVWWFNNKLEHEAINNSAVDRLHMIVDIRTRAYRC